MDTFTNKLNEESNYNSFDELRDKILEDISNLEQDLEKLIILKKYDFVDYDENIQNINELYDKIRDERKSDIDHLIRKLKENNKYKNPYKNKQKAYIISEYIITEYPDRIKDIIEYIPDELIDQYKLHHYKTGKDMGLL